MVCFGGEGEWTRTRVKHGGVSGRSGLSMESSWRGADAPHFEPIRVASFHRVDKIMRQLRRMCNNSPGYLDSPKLTKFIAAIHYIAMANSAFSTSSDQLWPLSTSINFIPFDLIN